MNVFFSLGFYKKYWKVSCTNLCVIHIKELTAELNVRGIIVVIYVVNVTILEIPEQTSDHWLSDNKNILIVIEEIGGISNCWMKYSGLQEHHLHNQQNED